MNYCVKCGNPVDDDMLFCPKCGAKIGVVQPDQTVPTNNISYQGTEADTIVIPKKKRKA